jgi:hypothetical protein
MFCEKSINWVNECLESVIRKNSRNKQIVLKKIPQKWCHRICVTQSYTFSLVHSLLTLQSILSTYIASALWASCMLATAKWEIMLMLLSLARGSFLDSLIDARTRSTESMSLQSELCSRFLTIFSLLKALSADTLDTAKQQNMLYRMVRLG